MDIQEDASSHENQDCDDFETSQSEQSGISSCKAKRGDRKLDLSGNGHSEVLLFPCLFSFQMRECMLYPTKAYYIRILQVSRKDSVDNGAHGGGKAIVNSSIQVEFLRFEVKTCLCLRADAFLILILNVCWVEQLAFSFSHNLL